MCDTDDVWNMDRPELINGKIFSYRAVTGLHTNMNYCYLFQIHLTPTAYNVPKLLILHLSDALGCGVANPPEPV